MTDATMQELIKESAALIKSTELAIAQVEANEDVTEIEPAYKTARLTVTKLIQQSQCVAFKEAALLQEQDDLDQQQDELSQKKQDLSQKQRDLIITSVKLNGQISDQAKVLDNILALAGMAPNEGKTH